MVHATTLAYPKDYVVILSPLDISIRCSSYWGRSPQDGLGDKQTCRMTLASAYVLCCLSAIWLQLQMIGRSPR